MRREQSAICSKGHAHSLYAQVKFISGDRTSTNPAFVRFLDAIKAIPELGSVIGYIQQNSNFKAAVGLSSQMWDTLAGSKPPELTQFVPIDSCDAMVPASDTDIMIHCTSDRVDLHFYFLHRWVTEYRLKDVVEFVDEVNGYRYIDGRELTEFLQLVTDCEVTQPEIALVGEGEWADGSYMVAQRYIYDLDRWAELTVSEQERIIGRTKFDAESIPDTVDLSQGSIPVLCQSHPYGQVSGEHGLFHLAYSSSLNSHQQNLATKYCNDNPSPMLAYIRAVTGAYYFAPSRRKLKSLQAK